MLNLLWVIVVIMYVMFVIYSIVDNPPFIIVMFVLTVINMYIWKFFVGDLDWDVMHAANVAVLDLLTVLYEVIYKGLILNIILKKEVEC